MITIGIPCYNAEKWLEGAIVSALNQTWPDVEVIVVDDGSTDLSPEIVRQYSGRVRFEQLSHCGGNCCRNRILEMARGRWIQFLDADDMLLPGKIAGQMQSMAGLDGIDAIFSPVLVEYHNPDGVVSTRPQLMDLQKGLTALWLDWNLPQTGGWLWEKQALEKIGGWKENQVCCQDYELYLRALQAGLNLWYSPVAEAVYRLWSFKTVSRGNPLQVIRERMALIENCQMQPPPAKFGQHPSAGEFSRHYLELCRQILRLDGDLGVSEFKRLRHTGRVLVPADNRIFLYSLVAELAGLAAAERVAATVRRVTKKCRGCRA